MTRIKICGITRAEDALRAVDLGVDAIGLVFYPPSPRHVELAQAQKIVNALPPFINVVGLFVNAKESIIRQVLAELPIDTLQMHGDEAPETCLWQGKKVIKAIRVKPQLDIEAEINRFKNVDAILLDAYQKGVPGGTGEVFDWQKIPEKCSQPIILAGGLAANNVVAAIQQVKPFAVDVSGGVEKSKGIKAKQKMEDFVRAVRGVINVT